MADMTSPYNPLSLKEVILFIASSNYNVLLGPCLDFLVSDFSILRPA